MLHGRVFMKKIWVFLTAALYIALGAAYGANRYFLTDSATGFSESPYWLQYLLLAAGMAFMLPLIFAIRPSQRVELGGASFRSLLMVLGVWFAVASIAEIVQHGADSALYSIHAVLQLGTAAWVIWLAVWSKNHAAPPRHSALWGILACASLYLLVPMRFMTHQSSIVRVGNTMQLLSALAALLFAASCLRRVYLPSGNYARQLCATGLCAFLLCSCQGAAALLTASRDSVTAQNYATNFALLVLGIVGLYTAVCCAKESVGQDQAQRQ